jgi:hypothetical protein
LFPYLATPQEHHHSQLAHNDLTIYPSQMTLHCTAPSPDDTALLPALLEQESIRLLEQESIRLLEQESIRLLEQESIKKALV